MTVNVAFYFIGGLFLGVILKHLVLCFRDQLEFMREMDLQARRHDALFQAMLVTGAVIVLHCLADRIARQNGQTSSRAGQPTKKDS